MIWKKKTGRWAKLFNLILLNTSVPGLSVFKKGVYELSFVADKLFLEIMSRFHSLSTEFKFKLNQFSTSELNCC